MTEINRQWILARRPVARVEESCFELREVMQRGFENVPKTLVRLYTGENFGKQLLAL